MATNPFTVKEVGEPGSLRAVADFTCPKCGEFSRFTPRDEDEEGGFTCPQCGLAIKISGASLADFQRQLDAINASLADFEHRVKRKVKLAAKDIVADPDGTGTPS